MKKYFVIDCTRGDMFEDIFDTFKKAKEEADYQWKHFSRFAKNQHKAFYIARGELDEDNCVDYEKGFDEVYYYTKREIKMETIYNFSAKDKEYEVYLAASGDVCVSESVYGEERADYNCGRLEDAYKFILDNINEIE